MILRKSPISFALATFLLLVRFAFAQSVSSEDAAVDQIRRLSNIGAIDRDSIRNWIQIQVDKLAQDSAAVTGLYAEGFKSFRARFKRQYTNGSNTSEFKNQFAAQCAAVAETEFAKPNLSATVGWALAHVLVDMQREAGTVSAFVSGLGASVPVARYLCAEGLIAQRSTIASDAARLPQVIQRLRDAAVAETSAPVLGRLYEALAFPSQQAAAFDAYLAVFDRRLDRHRTAPGAVDGAEIAAFEVLRSDRFLASLDANQKAELVRRVAVFMRMDAERYNDAAVAPPVGADDPDPAASEREIIERRLDAEEDILTKIMGNEGGKIRETFANGGYELHSEVLRQARVWVGDPQQSDQPGALAKAPWNVPTGAP